MGNVTARTDVEARNLALERPPSTANGLPGGIILPLQTCIAWAVWITCTLF